MIKKHKIVFLFSIVALVFGSISPVSIWAAGPTRVFVSIVPQKFFVKQIGKGLVHVQVMVKPGASPATYEPKPKQMADLSKAVIYFSIGVPFENSWLKKIAAANPQMKIVHTDHGIEKIPMAAHEHNDEREHYKKGDHHRESQDQDQAGHERDVKHHEHGILDPHIWLSPPLVKMQAHTILYALQQVDPSHKTTYEANYNEFLSRIDELDHQLNAMFEAEQGLRFMVYHPAWGYFADAYGLKQVPIEIEGKNPKPSQLKELIENAREKEIRVIFVQPQFSTKSAELVAKEIDGQVVFADPLAEDWLSNMREVAEKFKSALK